MPSYNPTWSLAILWHPFYLLHPSEHSLDTNTFVQPNSLERRTWPPGADWWPGMTHFIPLLISNLFGLSLDQGWASSIIIHVGNAKVKPRMWSCFEPIPKPRLQKQVSHFFTDVLGLTQLRKTDLQNAKRPKTLQWSELRSVCVWEKTEQCSCDVLNLEEK